MLLSVQGSLREIVTHYWSNTRLQFRRIYKREAHLSGCYGASKVISSLNLLTSLTMLKSIVALAALASTSSFAIAQRDVVPAYPFTQILPVPGLNSTTDSFNSLGNLYTSSAAQLSSEAVAIGMPRTPL